MRCPIQTVNLKQIAIIKSVKIILSLVKRFLLDLFWLRLSWSSHLGSEVNFIFMFRYSVTPPAIEFEPTPAEMVGKNRVQVPPLTLHLVDKYYRKLSES